MGLFVRLQGRAKAVLSFFVDTSVWSLALRRDSPVSSSEVRVLTRAIEVGEEVITTGLVLQELLQGFVGPRAQEQISDRFSALPLLPPDREDHVQAAALRNRGRRAGLRIGTIDALLAQLCIRHDLMMLATDRDFVGVTRFAPLELWNDR
ncbi:MAG: PIN domain-containing protein [Alphaproteobacteria bacterium]|nr:PIN domain-containing protein [Alphaproteobacteria bacterium]